MENNLLQQKWMVRGQKMMQAILLFLAVSFISAQDPPELFQFNQSTLQAAYFFSEVTINGNQIDPEDWVGAFNGDVCVGATLWDISSCGGGICEVMAMGNDGSEDTPGYCNLGDIPNFKIYDSSEDIYFDATPSENVAWANSGFNLIDNLAANSDDSGDEIVDGCDLPDDPNTSYLHLTDSGSVLYKSLYDIGGFQFNVDGTTLNDASGGDAGSAGFFISTNTGSGLVLGFSITGATIPAGCGTLIELDLSGEATGLINLIFSDSNAQAIYFEYYAGGDEPVLGCTDMDACNYNADATEDDGSCLENDCAGECGGSAEVDECDECGGDGIADGACDCDGNVDAGCGCGDPGPSGCDNACGSTLENDECGVCGGDGITDDACDCTGNVDLGCGCNLDGPSGCDMTCGSTLENDECGVCGGDGTSCGPLGTTILSANENNGIIQIFYNSSADFAGFEFVVQGAEISSD